jgi:hypothetical protein
VVAAASLQSAGFHGDDIAWLLDRAPGEVVIIRPEGDDHLNGGPRAAPVVKPAAGGALRVAAGHRT